MNWERYTEYQLKTFLVKQKRLSKKQSEGEESSRNPRTVFVTEQELECLAKKRLEAKELVGQEMIPWRALAQPEPQRG